MPSRRLLALVPVAFVSCLLAHGGQYVPPAWRGPGDSTAPRGPVRPNPPGPAGPTTPGGPSGGKTSAPASSGTPTGPSAPAGPTTGGPSAPGAPLPAGAAAAVPGATTPRGVTFEVDYDTWDYWWEFNKNSFLRLRDPSGDRVVETGSDDFYLGSTRRADARDTLRPTASEAVATILPALKRALDATTHRDIQSACLVAMAKIGRNHPEFTLFDVFAPRLRGGSQEIRETAALAFGIAGQTDARVLDLLVGLVHDEAAGRAARGGPVEERTRAFAAYALGLLAHGSGEVATKQRAFAALKTVVDEARTGSRDLRVAAIHGIGLLDLDARTYGELKLCDEALATLTACYTQDLGAGDQIVQAHCATAIVKLIGRDHPRSDQCKRLFAADLRGEGPRRRRHAAIAQSCVLALGQLVRPVEAAAADEVDARCNALLLEVYRDHHDALTRNFAILALGQIGGADNRALLLREFDKAGKTQQKPWCALALGVHAFLDGEVGSDRAVELALGDALLKAKDPGLAGALAIGLGLSRATTAADLMRDRLLANVGKEKMAGYLCVGLALMQDSRSVEDLRAVALQSLRRPELLLQAAIALGKLGDRRVAADLLAMLTEGEPNVAKLAAIAGALGQIGDRRTVPTLLQFLFDDRLTALSRAFAAVALGGIADRHVLPWNTPIAANANYRAAVDTLTDQTAGILDIL